MDDHRIRIGNIQSGLYDRCRYQYINLTINEIIHNPFQFVFPHLSVCIGNRQIRHQFLHMSCHFSYILDTVIDIVHLSLAGNFSFDCLPDHLIILLHHIGLDRHPVNWCFFQHTHVTDSDQAHMKGSRDRSCRKRQYIYIFL